MKIKTHRSIYNLSVIIYLLAISSTYASQYGPSLIFHKPYKTIPYASDFLINVNAGRATQGYNRHSKLVPFLQEYGSEDLLARFLDPAIDPKNIDKIGTMNFSGMLKYERMVLYYSKNIHQHLFFGIGTSIQNLNIGSINPNIILTKTLTEDEEKKLELFKSKIPSSLNTSGIFSTFLEAGYNNKFEDFESLHFLQIFLKGSIDTPQWMHQNNVSVLQYPLTGNLSFGYGGTAILAIGISKYINFGVYAMALGFQPTNKFAPVNTTESKNQIILTETTRIKIFPKPVYSTVFYIEAHSFLPHVMATIGYGSSTGMPWKVKSYDETNFPTAAINDSELLQGWSISALFFQLDYSFAHHNNPDAPAISLSYVLPLAGRFFPKVYTLAGACAMSFTASF